MSCNLIHMSNAYLNLVSQIVAFSDPSPNANPFLRYVDWKRNQLNVPVVNPSAQSIILMPNETRAIFSGTRSTAIDGSTTFTISQSPLDPSRYRFTGIAGTQPAFRVNRGLALSGVLLTLTANINGTLTMSAGMASPFGSVLASDIVFIPGPSTGDVTDGFNAANEGVWIVLSGTASSLTLVRSGDFSGMTEIVTPRDNATLAFGSSGVQVGDTVDISMVFSTAALKSFEVVMVTPSWFEVMSTSPLANESAAPTAAGMIFYSFCKRYLRVESDQDACVQVNGDTSTSAGRISALQVGGVGEFEKIGPIWSLTLVNRASVPANVVIISAE